MNKQQTELQENGHLAHVSKFGFAGRYKGSHFDIKIEATDWKEAKKRFKREFPDYYWLRTTWY